MPGMTVRPPSSTTRSSGPVSTGAPVRTVVMRRSSITTVLRGRAPSASSTVASRRTSLGTGAGGLVGSGHGSGTVLGHGGNDSDQKPMPAVARPGQAILPGFGAPVSLGANDTVLCSGTLRTGITFRERLAATRAGGFTGLSLWGRDYQVARDEGLSDRDIRMLLADHGLWVAELDPGWWWLPGASEGCPVDFRS